MYHQHKICYFLYLMAQPIPHMHIYSAYMIQILTLWIAGRANGAQSTTVQTQQIVVSRRLHLHLLSVHALQFFSILLSHEYMGLAPQRVHRYLSSFSLVMLYSSCTLDHGQAQTQKDALRSLMHRIVTRTILLIYFNLDV